MPGPYHRQLMSRDAILHAFDDHDDFEASDGTYQATITRFAAWVSIEPDDDSPVCELTVEVPTLDAVVIDETVPEVVANGWFDTLSRRLEDGYNVAGVPATDPVAIDRTETAITICYRFPADEGDPAAAAAALCTYVEGTYMEGIIPGYEYGDPVGSMLEAAQSTGGGEGEGAGRGGTPL